MCIIETDQNNMSLETSWIQHCVGICLDKYSVIFYFT